MNVITFKDRFEAPILVGTKTLTIRAPRKDGKPRAKVGERVTLRVWRGKPYRSKQREFAQATVLHVIPVRVSETGIHRPDLGCDLKRSFVARRDGFANWREMRAFFEANHGLPFEGVMVVWKDLEQRAGRAFDTWVAVADELPPRGVEVLVCQEGVDANARATLLKSGGWKFANRRAWMVIEASCIKTVTHWWKSSEKP